MGLSKDSSPRLTSRGAQCNQCVRADILHIRFARRLTVLSGPWDTIWITTIQPMWIRMSCATTVWRKACSKVWLTVTVSLQTKHLTDSGAPTEMNSWCIDMEMVGVFRGRKSRHLRQLPISPLLGN